MLTNNNVSIILVSPQMGENIGSTARVMKNFGLKDLRIVLPRDGWPNPKADIMSVGAIDIINQSRIFLSIEDAISDLSFVYATTGTSRNINKECVLSKNLDNNIPYNCSIGIMFGRESCGLNNQEITYANKILAIDTVKNFSSLNISHAVAIICYELFKTKNKSKANSNLSYILASQGEMNYFYDHLFSNLEKKDFFRVKEKKKHVIAKIKNLFSRIDKISQLELQTLRGIVTVLTSNK